MKCSIGESNLVGDKTYLIVFDTLILSKKQLVLFGSGISPLPTILEAGDLITITFSGGESEILANIESDDFLQLTSQVDGDSINIGSVPFTFDSTGNSRSIDLIPNQESVVASVAAIDDLIESDTSLASLLGSPSLSDDDKRSVVQAVNEGIDGVTISFNESDFFLLEEAELDITGPFGTFVQSGATIDLNSDGATLVGDSTSVLEEDVTVTFLAATVPDDPADGAPGTIGFF